MKVKVIDIVGERLRGYSQQPETKQVERALQEWLNNNPNAKIEHVVQTPLAGGSGITYRLLVTIFYRD